ncbi:MAG TPA: PAS domain-containing protein [Verrucomicrobiae bacterium]|nr:PAS domain-containing protein [Verrucomicrobiae bacterium]
MKFFSNPIFLQGVAILFCSSLAFLVVLVVMRKLRQSIQEEAEISSDAPALEALPLHVYNTVIHQLKQQHDELKAQAQAEQRRSRSTEQFTDAVLSNVSCGVLSVGKNGLIKSSNPAAKQILGFASLVGMHLRDIFRCATIFAESNCDADSAEFVSDEFDSILRSSGAAREMQAEYETPAGENRSLSITIVPVQADDNTVSGAACLISDITELSRLRREVTSGARPADGSFEAAQAAGSGV